MLLALCNDTLSFGSVKHVVVVVVVIVVIVVVDVFIFTHLRLVLPVIVAVIPNVTTEYHY